MFKSVLTGYTSLSYNIALEHFTAGGWTFQKVGSG